MKISPSSNLSLQPHPIAGRNLDRSDMVGDDYGHSDLAYHGGDIPTPNMDRWSALGVRLEGFYTQPSKTSSPPPPPKKKF